MKYISQFLIILLFSALGELLSAVIPLPIPAAIYGMILLFLALCTGLVKPDRIRRAAQLLIDNMPILFIAPTVNILACWGVLQPVLLPVGVIILVSTPVVFAVSGLVTKLFSRKGDADNG